MLKKLFFSIIFFLFVFTILSAASSNFKTNSDAYITVNNLNYRNKPTLKGSRLGAFPYSTKVVIKKKSAKTTKIGDKVDYWYYVESGKDKGWVFGAFLSAESVQSKESLIKKLKGAYYYCDIKRKNKYPRILKIKGETYTERRFNNYIGLTDLYEGKVVYQADNIMLIPSQRKVRPNYYINYPYDNQEQTAYNNAYYQWSDDANHLYKLKRFPASHGKMKLYIVECDKIIYMKQDKKGDCKSLKWAYMRK